MSRRHQPPRPRPGRSRTARTGLARLRWLVPITAGALLVLGPARAASGQSDGDAVPCDVAMVVGCDDGSGTPDPDNPSDENAGSDQDAGSGETSGPDEDGSLAGSTAETGDSGDADPNPSTADSTGAQATDGSAEPAPAPAQQPDEEPPTRSGVDPWERGGLQSNFGTSSIPISHYQIGADTSGFLGVPDPLDTFVASQTNWAFTSATFLVVLATNALDWAFEFPLANELVGDAGLLAQDYTIDFFGFGLSTSVYGLALSVTMIVAAFKAVTKGLIVAGSEVLLAFAAYVVLIFMTLTSGFGDAGLYVARMSSSVSSSIASFGAGEERQQECAEALQANRVITESSADSSLAGISTSTTEADAIAAASASTACSFGYAMQRSLIELPYQNLQWGQVLDGVEGKERCAEINRELLAEGPWGNSDEPRDRMDDVDECKENAAFNSQASYIRLGIAAANTVSTAIVTLLVLIVAAMLLWQQLKLLFLTAIMPHALVFAILPGRSRAVAWQWVEQLVGVLFRTVILSLGLVVWLSLFSLIVYEQLTIRGIFLSLFASTAMAISGFYGLYKLSSLTRRVNPIGEGRRRLDGDTKDGGPEPTGPRPVAPRTTRLVRSTLRTVQTRRRAAGPVAQPTPTRRGPVRDPASSATATRSDAGNGSRTRTSTGTEQSPEAPAGSSQPVRSSQPIGASR